MLKLRAIFRKDDYKWTEEYSSSEQELSFSEKCRICLRIFTNKSKFEHDQLRHKQQFSDLGGDIQCPCNNCGILIPRKVNEMTRNEMIHNDFTSNFYAIEYSTLGLLH